MTFSDFYEILDSELDEIISEYPTEKRFLPHKSSESNRKSYAFMIWILRFYGKLRIYELNIIDGDDDASCDIIFSTIDTVGKKVFYIIQVKWKTKNNINGKLDSKEFKSTLDDFKLIHSGRKEFSSKNQNFNQQYEELKKHIASNQYVKFVYVSLTQNNPSVIENVEAFNKQFADLEIIDIERLRRDFIEVRYKQIQPTNPLEYDYNPEDEPITLPIEQLEIEKNYLRVEAPRKTYIFLIRAKTVFELFEKYGFKLFFKNIRNPLIASNYNHRIVDTMRNAPDSFLYFNNGITAITSSFPNRIHATAQQIDIVGLQIINGAQTVYSIYKAYKDAKNGERARMNNALVQLRLVVSVDRQFDSDITRYTNQQNPTEPRDFYANDPVQIRLQNESFATNYWYEIRRGEFRNIPENIEVQPNEWYLALYLGYLGQPFYGFNDNSWNNAFSKILNDTLKFDDLLVPFLVDKILANPIGSYKGKLIKVSLSDFRVVFNLIYVPSTNQRVIAKIEKNSNFIYQMLVFIRFIKEGFENQFYLDSQHFDFNDFNVILDKVKVKPNEQDIESIDLKAYFDIQ